MGRMKCRRQKLRSSDRGMRSERQKLQAPSSNFQRNFKSHPPSPDFRLCNASTRHAGATRDPKSRRVRAKMGTPQSRDGNRPYRRGAAIFARNFDQFGLVLTDLDLFDFFSEEVLTTNPAIAGRMDTQLNTGRNSQKNMTTVVPQSHDRFNATTFQPFPRTRTNAPHPCLTAMPRPDITIVTYADLRIRLLQVRARV